MEHNLIKNIKRITDTKSVSAETQLNLVLNAIEQYDRGNLKSVPKYIKIFDNASGYLKYDTKMHTFTVGNNQSMSGWYKVKFDRSQIDPKLYDIFGTEN